MFQEQIILVSLKCFKVWDEKGFQIMEFYGKKQHNF